MEIRDARPTDQAIMTDTVDAAEIGKFDRMAATWWDAEGEAKPLHRMNPVRLDYIRDHVCAQYGRDPAVIRPFEGLSVVDVGCGGGLLCEPMARLGGDVTGVDASVEAVSVARDHADEHGLTINYRADPADALVEEGEQFDVVLAMEIVEHVADIPAFLSDVAALAKPGALIFLSTLNRTAKSYALAIGAAEYLLRWLPRGTHDWNKFPTPAELEAALIEVGLVVVDDTGFTYAALRDKWSRSNDMSVNYALVAEKPQ